ncbi:MAG: hypothetical protein ACLUNU_07565, partial [Anaerobutyricum soehngenii]
MFKMLIRILNTLPSRIWDRVLFLFSDCSKSTIGENGNSPEGYSYTAWIFFVAITSTPVPATFG